MKLSKILKQRWMLNWQAPIARLDTLHQSLLPSPVWFLFLRSKDWGLDWGQDFKWFCANSHRIVKDFKAKMDAGLASPRRWSRPLLPVWTPIAGPLLVVHYPTFEAKTGAEIEAKTSNDVVPFPMKLSIILKQRWMLDGRTPITCLDPYHWPGSPSPDPSCRFGPLSLKILDHLCYTEYVCWRTCLRTEWMTVRMMKSFSSPIILHSEKELLNGKTYKWG